MTYVGDLAFASCTELTSISYGGKYDVNANPDSGILSGCTKFLKLNITHNYLHDTFMGYSFDNDGKIDMPAQTPTPSPISTNKPSSTISSFTISPTPVPTSTQVPTATPIPQIIEKIDVPENTSSFELDKIITETFDKMNDNDNGTNKIIIFNGDNISYNSSLEKNQFIKPGGEKSEIQFEGGNLNLILPETGKVKVSVTDENVNLSINGNGNLEINQANFESSSVHLSGNSKIDGPVSINVSDNVKSISIDSIEMDKFGSISVKNTQKEDVDLNVYDIKLNVHTNASIYKMSVLKSLTVAQTATLTLDNITLDDANVKFELYDLKKDNDWTPFFLGNFNNPPKEIVLNKYSKNISVPKANEDFVFISGLFEDQQCKEWLKVIDLSDSGFNTKRCISSDDSKFLSESEQIVLSNKKTEEKSKKLSIDKSKLRLFIGIAIACVAVLIIIIIIVVVVFMKKSKIPNATDSENSL